MLIAMRKLLIRHGANRAGSVSARLALTILCLTLGACAGVDSRGELPTVASVDLSRYVGTWYEIARLPMWFSVTAWTPRRRIPAVLMGQSACTMSA